MKVSSTLHFAKQKIVNIFNEKKNTCFFYIKNKYSTSQKKYKL